MSEENGIIYEQKGDYCYIQKIKPFFSGERIYYEVTFTVANDKISKFDRIMVEMILELKRISEKCDEIGRKIVIWSN